jgi:hypothetical protein
MFQNKETTSYEWSEIFALLGAASVITAIISLFVAF